ncbi:MAG TPA: hypothetical protein VMV37_10145 [Gammaproteobacteria bacterium]|nr:hypothetical protein [Gammaproteobacteria bacterium]
MTDAEITRVWSTLEPSTRERARIETRVLEWVEAGETSLVTEWLDVIRVNPIGGLGLVAASAAALLMLTPIGWIASSMLR